MPAVPVLPGSSTSGFDGWSLWQKGRICAANVTWSVDAYDANAQQNYLLSTLAIARGYNAIRLALTAGGSDAAWEDMLLIATSSWADTVVSSSADTAAIGAATRLATSNTPVANIRDTSGNLVELGIVGQIDNILIRCAQRGLGVILDVHDFYQREWTDGAGTTHVGPLWTGSSASGHTAANLRTALVSLWAKIVQRWGPSNWLQVWRYSKEGSPSDTVAGVPWPVIGYEILNEPNPDQSKSFAQMQADPSKDNNWKDLAERCVTAIRAVDANTAIVVDGIYYADARGLAYFNEAGLVSDPNSRVVYSFHAYGPQDFTHRGVTDDLYASIGLRYPLKEGTGTSSPKIYLSYFDGSASWVGSNGGSTARAAYLSFDTHADFVSRVQTAIDFKAAHPTVPIFVGEFSAVNPALLRSTQVPTDSPARLITGIEPDGLGHYKIWLGHLTGGLTMNVFPQAGAYAAPASNDPDPFNGYGGAYNDDVLATVTVAPGQNTSFNIANQRVRIPHGSKYILISYPSGQQPSGTLGAAGGGSAASPQVATLTLAPYDPTLSAGQYSRMSYITDVLRVCQDNGFSWAYWQEDGCVGTPDSLPPGAFIGWRPTRAMSEILSMAADGRSVG